MTKKKAAKYVYYFGGSKAEGKADMKNLLGGKGANLAEMVNIGIPVPSGFTITTEVCTYYTEKNKKYPKELKSSVDKVLAKVEKQMGAKFGDSKNPLLVSVRSGARASMPGMMDTILNLGLNDTTVEALSTKTGNPRFAYDSYRRFVQMYGDVVLGLQPVDKHDRDPFELILEKKKKVRKIELDTELSTEDLKELVAEFKAEIKKKTGHAFPTDPMQQLWGAIGAVFESWQNERAVVYRKLNDIPVEWGTAVNVQSMVFGNMGEDSGTGVAFTRDPSNGDNMFYGEYLFNAQGEDVVAGVRTPLPIVELKKDDPIVYKELIGIRSKLEKHYHDMMDVEFTIQQGKLWMLQARVGKRTGFAAVKIAVDMVRQKLISNAANTHLKVSSDFVHFIHKTEAGQIILLALAPHGTEFQLIVLNALQRIPYGETRSYGELARDIGRPNASRAVGAANGRNPLPIVIPCHRVIGSNGTLTGFGGGLEIKQFLLDLENSGQAEFDI